MATAKKVVKKAAVKKAVKKVVAKKAATAPQAEAYKSSAQKRADAVAAALAAGKARRIGRVIVPVTYMSIEDIETAVGAVEGVVVVIRRPRSAVAKGAEYGPKTFTGSRRVIRPAADTSEILKRLASYGIDEVEVEILSGT